MKPSPRQRVMHVLPEPRGHTTPPRAAEKAAPWIAEQNRQLATRLPENVP